MGRYDGTVNRGHLGFHLRVGPASKLYHFRDLESKGVVNDLFEKLPLVVAFSPKAAAAAAWDRRVGDKTLTFDLVLQKGRLRLKDKETGSLWKILSGACVEGPSKGQSLKPVVGIPIRLDRWRGFYPRGVVYRSK